MADKIVPQEACMLCFPEPCTCAPRDKRKKKKVVNDDGADEKADG